MNRELILNGEKVTVDVLSRQGKSVTFTWQGQQKSFELIHAESGNLVLVDEKGEQHRLWHDGALIVGNGRDADFAVATQTGKKGTAQGGSLNAPMPGKVFKIVAKAGDTVKTGQTLLVLEAMKMEHAIKAPADGVVKKILFAEGQLVPAGALLVDMEKS